MAEMGGTATRAAVGAIAVVVVANATVWWVAAGWPEGVGDVVFDVFAISWLSVPSVVAIALFRTRLAGTQSLVFAAPAVAAGVAWFAYSSIRDTSSSTNGVGAVVAPILGLLAIGVLWGVSAFVAELARRRRERRVDQGANRRD
jgi:hypothetical protein